LGDYYYWQANDREAWADRFPEGTQLVVTYSDGKTKEPYLSDLVKQAKIWWNAEAGDATNNGITITPNLPNTDLVTRPLASNDFDIVPIQYPLTVKKNPEPGIVLYYRGAVRKIKVDVLTTLLAVQVTSKDPSGINFDPAATQDNDIWEGLKGTRGLASLIDVKAQYAAYNDASVQRDLDLEYYLNVMDSLSGTGGTPFVPYYTFDKGTGDEATYESGYTKWEAAANKGKLDILGRAVTVGHSVLESDFSGPISTNGLPSVGSPGITASRFPVAASPTGAYIFSDIPDFRFNLVRAKDKVPGTGTPGNPSEATGGWQWEWNTSDKTATGAANGSGIKQPAKAKVDKPTVNWLVKTPIPE